MSDNPPQSPEIPDSQEPYGSSPVTSKSPLSITVFGGLNLASGFFWICFWSLLLITSPFASPEPLTTSLMEWGEMGLGFLSSILLLVAGICLLKKQRLGRTLSNIYGIYGIVNTLFFVFLEVLMPNSPNSIPGGPVTFWDAIDDGLFGMIYPILLLIFLNRDKVKQALH